MKTVGITGGMGSGKSIVATVFEHLRIPVYNSDERAKALYNSSPELKAFLLDWLGPEVYPQGIFEPGVLSKHLTQNPKDWTVINQVVHPLVAEDYTQWEEQQRTSGKAPYVLKESALLFELGLESTCDATLLVTAPEALRIHRVIKRSGLSDSEIRGRMAKQWPESKKRELADYIIDNSGSESLIHQVLKIHENLCK